MITYYTLIAEPLELSLNSHFYMVKVGSTKKAQQALFVLNAHCRQNKLYFYKQCREDDVFRLKVAKSLGVKVFELPEMVIDVETLAKSIINHDPFPWQPHDSENLHYLKQKTDTNYLLFCNTSCLKRGKL